MRNWDAQRVADVAGAQLVRPGAGEAGGPVGFVIDSRLVAPGDLFVGLPGTRADGGAFAADVLHAGAWGVLVTADHAGEANSAADARGGAVLLCADPALALGELARGWRRELGARVVGVTGSTGKTSTKDILAALLAQSLRVHASRENFNTEIGLPLELLGAPAFSDVVVLEMAMRGAGQIAELTAIAEPDVGVIVNVGPVHVELLGSVQAVAAAKAELLADLRPGATAVIPADEPLLEPFRRDDLDVVTFGPGGDVFLRESQGDSVEINARGELLSLEFPFPQAHQRSNLLAAVAAAQALGVTPTGRLDVELSAMRGQRIELADGTIVIDDCYNANPMSMLAALDDLAATAPGRRVAILGDMLELGPDGAALHDEVGRQASERGVEVLVTVGELSREMRGSYGGETHHFADARDAAAHVGALVESGDTVLVKASRGIGLEAVTEALRGRGRD